MRLALGIAYRGGAYRGWQSQPGGGAVQDHVEAALSRFAAAPLRCVCAGRTDAGVHALNQVVHVDADVEREAFSWVRGTNRYLPSDVAVQWCRPVADDFHARFGAIRRRYAYLLLDSPVRPAIEHSQAGWVFRTLDEQALHDAAAVLIGRHDFSAFRSSECQAKSPIKTIERIDIVRRGAYWRFEFEADAFLHHMVRNLMGSLLAVGQGQRDVAWLTQVLGQRDRAMAAPTFAADGLYFLGPHYDARFGLPERTPAFDWLP